MAETMTIGSVQPVKRSKLSWAIRDSWALVKRSVLHIVKSPDQLMAAAFQPIMFTLLFVYVFGGAIHTGTSYINFLMAGILVQTAAFGASTTAVGVATDMQRGIIDRFKSLPMLSSAVLFGHVSADLARNFISGAIMVAVGYLIGFRPQASLFDWAIIIALLMMFTFALSWLFAIVGLLAKSVEAVQWVGFIFIFPLTFASSAFVPTDNMPHYLKVFAVNQPVTQIIESIRALLLGLPVGNHVWQTVIWSTVLTVIAVPLAGYLFRKSASK